MKLLGPHWIALWAILAAFPALGAPCPIERARYVMAHDRHFTAGFAPIGKYAGWPTDLALFVHSAKTRITYWFVFDAAPLSRIDLLPTTNVRAAGWRPPGPKERNTSLDNSGYLATDAHRTFLAGLPRQGSKAPQFFLLPDLSERLWYHYDTREDVDLDFFTLRRCAGRR